MQDATPQPRAAGLSSAHRAAIAAGALLGAAIAVVGLPGSVTIFGRVIPLTVYGAPLAYPAGLLVALGTIVVVGLLAADRSWTVADLVVASVLAVAGGVLFSIWNATYNPISEALNFYPPIKGLYVGVWLLPAVLGALVIRKPGAAIYTELVAAVISALVGSQWGVAVIWYGLLQGLGAEIVVALLLYRRFGWVTAAVAGAAAGVVSGSLDLVTSYPFYSADYKVLYVAAVTVSGAVIAGLGSYALATALKRTGALAPLASGRDAERV
jgi:energy-coupling factor transport system permease protein